MTIEDVAGLANPLMQMGHVDCHDALHAAYNAATGGGLPIPSAMSDRHVDAHRALKEWYDADHYIPLVEVRTQGDHLIAHELLHAWRNGEPHIR